MIKNTLYRKSKETINISIATKYLKSSEAFTIVELLVVIVVIGILAAITIVSYIGVTSRANAVSAQSDLSNISTQLKLYQTIYGSYPTIDPATKCPTAPIVDNTYCLKASSGNTLVYSTYHNLDGTDNLQNFGLSVKNNNASYSNNATDIKCPIGFIVVPGSTTYGTNDFCVMKYEAKQVGTSTTPISTAAGLPWVNISQTTAIANAPNTKNTDGSTCTICHLITEPEYMTIAQNVLSVASNWSGGVVGTGYIYSGHNDNVPANALAASTDDTDGYFGTGNTTGSNQRRNLTLSNGEVIWDMAGNVYDWTAGTIGANLQPGLTGEVAYAWKEWNNGSLLMNGLPYNSQPASTGIAGITWNTSSGVGQFYSNYGETGTRAFMRGGEWDNGGIAGVLSLYLFRASSYTGPGVGFRVSR